MKNGHHPNSKATQFQKGNRLGCAVKGSKHRKTILREELTVIAQLIKDNNKETDMDSKAADKRTQELVKAAEAALHNNLKSGNETVRNVASKTLLDFNKAKPMSTAAVVIKDFETIDVMAHIASTDDTDDE